ncbi:hypothetical protein N7456_009184 [Penicillium angulare]|uniref:Copper acquisition factor BIM1-like domain-containing protein n=1 Tax=Penicillium angulare TaxID=116970 RepID=A0A9W9F447_9EURO|nr:hypothetical protein N7456_009184 [Penicillium angulare]
MHGCTALLALASLYLTPSMAADEATDMGPAAFLWPPDRTWSKTADNTAPCGSNAGVENRTEFPLTNGEVSLVLQDESYNVNLAISYHNDPTSNIDFVTDVAGSNFPDLYPGHECYSVPNPPSNMTSGSNATLQLSYQSTFDTDTNQTYYACADITYVPLASFTTDVLCFNVSVTDTASTTTATSSSSSKSSGLSGGQIAGIVVGSVVGAALIVGGLFLLWSRHQRKVQRDKVVAVRMGDWGNKAQKTVSADEQTV